MEVKIPEVVNVVELESAPFKTVHEAADWARGHGVVGLMSSVDTGGKGEISISMMSIGKMLSGSAMHKSVTPAIHLAALVRLRDIIRESFVGECHPDYLKVNGKRSPDNGCNPLVDIAVLYGCVALGGIPYRSKTTLKFFKDAAAPTKAYSYEVSSIEVLKGIAAPVALPSDKTSIDASILLNGVCDVNGVPLLVNTTEAVECQVPVIDSINDKLEISVLYGAVSFGGLAFRVKTTLKLYHEPGHPHKAYSYQVCNVEVIKGNEILKGIRRASARPDDRISMSVDILLNGVCDINGVPLLANSTDADFSRRSMGSALV